MTVDNGTTAVTSTYFIYPSDKHKREFAPSRMSLSALDGFCDQSQMLFYWIFQSAPNPINPVVDKLKDSLAEALELCRPVAGTLYREDDGISWYIEMDTENIQKTPFHFETRNIPYSSYKNHACDLLPRGTSPLPFGSSIFAVKVTQFSCGTLIVVGSMNHTVADLHGYLDFMKVWSRLAREGSVDLKTIPQDWSRSLGRFFPPLQGEPVNPFCRIAAGPTAAEAAGLSPSTSPFKEQEVRVVVWKTTQDLMKQLKMDLSSSFSLEDQWISSGDALTALFFGALTRARQKANIPRTPALRSSIESQTESLYTVYDCRSRAVPEGEDFQYFGNATILCKAAVPRAELMSPTIEATSRVALNIRNDVRTQLSPSAIANYLAFYEDLKVKKRSPYEVFAPMDVYCINYTKFDMQLDFGWGKSCKSSICGEDIPSTSGTINILQDKEPGDIAVMLSIEVNCIKLLESDSLLNKYATPRV